ncbi:MAG TPA: MazG nucleotide pyrophosphohydrolase domain-containing protein [Candidatus Saccharimonadales bacterium]|jgi:NTP pyrophosphatase (non-canonical NTP hydrolase)|nr:MazG nucleotide pyrophosphohydrolase domain-containing protein [Candidatus Saccharimonadales bacterium]
MSNLHLEPNPTLKDLQEYVAEMVRERGFTDDDIAKKFMMLTEEVGEFSKAARVHAGMKLAKDSRDQDLEGEAADILIVLLGLCNMMGIDLEKAFRDKEEKNKKREWTTA